jgi:hypothetical protein
MGSSTILSIALGPRHVRITSATVWRQLKAQMRAYLGGDDVGRLRLAALLALGPGVCGQLSSMNVAADVLMTTMGIPPGIAIVEGFERGGKEEGARAGARLRARAD